MQDGTPAAEDAVQEALILAYTRLHQLKDPAAFFPWISRIVTNCCYQYLRNNRSLPVADISDRLIEESIYRRQEAIGMRNTLYASLSLLPEPLRLAMMLRYLSDYPSYAQIAKILGIPVGTVRSRLSEGRKQLTRHWNQLQHAGTTEYGNTRYWNQFYTGLLPGVHKDAGDLRMLLNSIVKPLEIIFTSGKTVRGRDIFEQSLYDDIDHGSGVSEVKSCITSGNMTVMDVSFANSSEHPDHCPPGTFLIFRREGALITSLRMFHSARPDQVVASQYA